MGPQASPQITHSKAETQHLLLAGGATGQGREEKEVEKGRKITERGFICSLPRAHTPALDCAYFLVDTVSLMSYIPSLFFLSLVAPPPVLCHCTCPGQPSQVGLSVP